MKGGKGGGSPRWESQIQVMGVPDADNGSRTKKVGLTARSPGESKRYLSWKKSQYFKINKIIKITKIIKIIMIIKIL